MSEPAPETETPAPSPDVPQPEPDIPFEEPEPEQPTPDEPQPEPEPQQPPSETDAEIEALYTKLETKAKNYTKGVVELIGDSGLPVAGCEMCADCYPGLRWVEPQDETHQTLLAVVGAADGGSPLNDDPDALLCDRCNGFGHTKLPSHVPGNDTRMCRQCNGAGWLDRSRESGAPVAPAPLAENGPAEALPGVPEDDASVIDLRSRGYTIIPPMQIAATEQ